ncbi:MAG: Oxygen-dependent choline dehydrogenase [Sodalis sp.]|nr:MAG: Oxygen-dependent choline dehydrogenase [Sodalis sp.]
MPATRRCRAKQEAIFSLSAIRTPKVLVQSGISPADELQCHGILAVQYLPGVSQNHQDHVSLLSYLRVSHTAADQAWRI